MLGKCFFIICVVSVICAAATGNLSQLSNAVIDGASSSVELTLALAGNMCLWCGIMEVLRRAGAVEKLSLLLSPILRHVFPHSWKNNVAKGEITAAISANMLGIGNAATPFAIDAMRKMQENNPDKDTATDDMVTLAVLGTSSVNILPTTLVALRRSVGSAAPFRIILPIWICSSACAVFGMTLSRTLAKCKKSISKSQLRKE
ncbi:MAG: spore maturation protein A [Ruminococcaceae bacterium]|nr:spore maturation protein A [Oscillospiraceae bacterium]MBE6708187.1 spore maturation protein A [Oscillospiraceae bacterium]